MKAGEMVERRGDEIGTGKPCEICVWRAHGGWKTAYGILRYYSREKVTLEIAGDMRTVEAQHVRYLKPLDEIEHCKSFRVGEGVRLKKYGSTYNGVVERVSRTRLTVLVQLRHRERRIPVRAIEVERRLPGGF